jgi:hypothetical protein
MLSTVQNELCIHSPSHLNSLSLLIVMHGMGPKAQVFSHDAAEKLLLTILQSPAEIIEQLGQTSQV